MKLTEQQITNTIAAIKNFQAPALTGSEKQVAWASTIRATYLKSLKAYIARYEQYGGSIQDALIDAIHSVKKTEARWWIDERNNLKVR